MAQKRVTKIIASILILLLSYFFWYSVPLTLLMLVAGFISIWSRWHYLNLILVVVSIVGVIGAYILAIPALIKFGWVLINIIIVLSFAQAVIIIFDE